MSNVVKHPSHSISKWPDGVNRQGVPKTSYGNVLAAIGYLRWEVRYDTFRNKMMVEGHDLMGEGEVSDHVIITLRDLIYKKFKFHPPDRTTRDAITVIGRQHMFNPIEDWLLELKWDGTARVERMFTKYLGAKNQHLTRAIARKLMCAMVRRARKPGTKFDYMIILEGDQDIGKSRFCQNLAGRADLFTDTSVLNRETKAQMESVEGKWVVEIAELQGMQKAEIDRVKAFLSRDQDRERKAYAHFRTEVPRTCICIGTTNSETYLKDPTGNRRFWPVRVVSYDHEAFLRDRDQIFAEAVVLEPNENLWLDSDDLRELAALAQEQRMEPNPYVDRLRKLVGVKYDGEERIFASDVWRFLGINDEELERQHKLRNVIADAMRQLGWRRKIVRIEEEVKRGYWRPLDV
jgi:predicted P-loop ATPase